MYQLSYRTSVIGLPEKVKFLVGLLIYGYINGFGSLSNISFKTVSICKT